MLWRPNHCRRKASIVTTEDFIIELYCRVDDRMRDVPQHSQALLHPGELVTLAFMFAIKGVGNRAFDRWLRRDFRHLFPALPERTRLFRLFKTHAALTERFMAEPTVLGVVDSYGIELIHPVREGRSPRQYGRKGLSNRRFGRRRQALLAVEQVRAGRWVGVRSGECLGHLLPTAHPSLRSRDDRLW